MEKSYTAYVFSGAPEPSAPLTLPIALIGHPKIQRKERMFYLLRLLCETFDPKNTKFRMSLRELTRHINHFEVAMGNQKTTEPQVRQTLYYLKKIHLITMELRDPYHHKYEFTFPTVALEADFKERWDKEVRKTLEKAVS